MDYYIVVDIGATYTRVGLASSREIIDKIVFETPREGDEYTIANKIYETVLKHYHEHLDKVKTIGVATIGPLDIRKGLVTNTPNIPIGSFEIVRPLSRSLGKPVYVLNDAVAAVYGEKIYGDGVDYNNIVYVTLSTGVGGGVIVDNHLLIGKDGNAHEIGHIVVNYDSRIRCGCGGLGHWEAYAGGSNIPKLAKTIAEEHREIVSQAYLEAVNETLNPVKLFKYYRSGDHFAKLVVEEIIKACVAGFSSIINAYDPELITIGGSVFLNNIDILLKPIIDGVQGNIINRMPLIKPTKLGSDVVLYGALALATNPPVELKAIQERDIN